MSIMKKYIVIFITLLIPLISRSTVGQHFYVYPLFYTITQDVVVYGTNSYSMGEVMVGIKDGWGNGNASGNVVLNSTVKYNNYEYVIGYLGKWAFRENDQMTSITIPKEVKAIRTEAFLNCSALKKVIIKANTSIEGDAFYGCEVLETVEFNGTSFSVGSQAFKGCRSLVTFPFEKLWSVNFASFSGCSSLSNVTLKTTNIGINAFENCTSLTSVTFTGNSVNIGDRAFSGCRKLKSVTTYMNKDNFTPLTGTDCFSGIRPEAVLYVPNGMKSYYENDPGWHSAFAHIKAIAPALGETFTANIPVGDESIELSFEVTDVENMEVVITGSTCNISSPIDLVIPSRISCQDWQFKIAGIRTSALSSIQDIHSVEVGWRFPVDAANNFNNISDDVVLYVPAGSKQRYEAHESWKSFPQIVEISPISVGDASSIIGSQVEVPIILNSNEEIAGLQFKLTLPNGVSIQEKDGELNTLLTDRTSDMTVMGRKDPDAENSYLFVLFSLEGNPIIGNEGSILNVKLNIDLDAPLGIHDIIIEDVHMATSTFNTRYPATASSELLIESNVRNIDFADANVKAICVSNWDLNEDGELDTGEVLAITSLDGAFKGNTEIATFEELRYFTGLTTISKDFDGCSCLASVVIPRSVTNIENGAFSGCSALNSIIIDEENTKYDSRDDCNAIIESETNTLILGCVSTMIPNSITAIGENAFYGCTDLTALSIPNSIISIGENAFYGCHGLESIVVDAANKVYDSRDNCNAIIETETNTLILACANTVIPNSIKAIGNSVFRNFKGLTTLVLPENLASIGEYAFDGCSNLTIVKLKNATPIKIQGNVFSNRSKATLYVPMGSLDDYRADNQWNQFKVLKAYPDGDVNQDGETDVVDVVDIARFVVGTPRDAFDEYLADLNYDDLVNVADAVTLVNVIAGDTNFARTRASLTSNDALTLIENANQSLSLALEGNDQYTAFQFDLILPNDLDVTNISLNSQRKQKHQLLYNKVSDGKYRVTALSTSNRVFLGTAGELINIAIDGRVTSDIMVDNIHFVTVQGNDIPFNAVYLNGSSTTGIDGLEGEFIKRNQKIYNLNGQRIAAPQKGINIIGDKKVVVK